MLFYQPEIGYRFNSDSIFLYDFAASFLPQGSVLDVGCGVGVIGLLLARDFPIELTLVEKQKIMAFLAERNIRANGIDAELVQTDFLEFHRDRKFDFIVSNPPFYHMDVIQSEDAHMHACRYNAHLPLERFFKRVKSLLAPRGRFIFCYDAMQIGELFLQLDRVGLRVEDLRFVHPKSDRAAKLVMIHARNNSKARCRVREPLIVFEGSRYTQEAQRAFNKARTHTIKCQVS